jgi:hypothetical protein
VTSKSSTPDIDAATGELGRVVSSGLWYLPNEHEVDQVRTYLAEMQASIQLLPDLEPEADSLDVGYDPSWPEVAQ